MADVGFGATITFSTGFCAEILSWNYDGLERAMIDSSHMTSTEGWMTFLASDLKNPGAVTVQLQFIPGAIPPITGAFETVTLTHPIPTGLSNGATVACSGALQSIGSQVPHDGKMVATAVIKFSGKPTFTAAS